MSDDKNFHEHWRMPKSKIKKIRKEYESAKQASEEIPTDKLRNFSEAIKTIFSFFEQISEKKTNREIMVSHIVYYLDEGYEPEEILLYIRYRFQEDYFKINPEKFTIANLFPIKDQDRINMTWDLLAHFQSLKYKGTDKKETLAQKTMVTLRCGHKLSQFEWEQKGCCPGCIVNGNLIEIIQSPYIAFEILKDEHLKELAHFFMRHGEESLNEYAQRTYPKRKEICNEAGIKIASADGLTGMLNLIQKKA